ncbi:MAG: hypothetical protein ACTHLY_17770 [Pseudolabrys sp.]
MNHSAVDFSEFTEAGYRSLIGLAVRHWRFEGFGSESAMPHVLWRHEVDMSPQRAKRIAEIESDLNVRSTFFFYIHSEFYNCLDRESRDCVREIVDGGHWIGLHFDPGFYRLDIDLPELERRIHNERAVLEDIAGVSLTAVSFHNPTTSNALTFEQPHLGGLVNAYSATIRSRYRYCSDSNGYWRFDPLSDVLAQHDIPRLHILTHPEWWTPQALSPRDRVSRAIDGRAAAVHQAYDNFLEFHGRANIRS